MIPVPFLFFSVLFFSVASLSTTERQPSAPCEKINNRMLAIFRHSSSFYKFRRKDTKNI